jgi:hypothetical protein
MATPLKPVSNITLRLDVQTRYRLELLSRQQRRSQTSVIEHLIQQESASAFADFQSLWATDEPERVVRLAVFKPDLMTFDESAIWTVIERTPSLWDKVITRCGINDDGEPWVRTQMPPGSLGVKFIKDGEKMCVASPNIAKIAEHWEALKEEASVLAR